MEHRISSIDPDAGTATCEACGPVDVYHRPKRGTWVCRNKRRQDREARTARDRSEGLRAPANRDSWLRYKFAISLADYEVLLDAQGGTCAICDSSCSTGWNLAVDHDHESGRVRGLLCNRCNRGLGLFGDDLERLRRAVAYLSA